MKRLWNQIRLRLPVILPPRTTWHIAGTGEPPRFIALGCSDGQMRVVSDLSHMEQVALFHEAAARLEQHILDNGCTGLPQ